MPPAKKAKKKAAGKSRVSLEPFVRVDVGFVLNDPRWLRLSDTSARIYIQLSAVALQVRKEVLPPYYDISSIALMLHRSAPEVEKSVKELCDGPKPLLTIVSGNCIRINGFKKRYDGRMQWKDNCEQLETTADNCKQVQTTALEKEKDVVRAVAVDSIHECSPDVDDLPVDARSCCDELPPEPKPTTEPTTTSTSGMAHASQNDNGDGTTKTTSEPLPIDQTDRAKISPTQMELMDIWHKDAPEFREWESLRGTCAMHTDPSYMLAHAMEVENDATLVKKLQAFYRRLFPRKGEKRKNPGETIWNQAREIISTEERDALGDASTRGGQPSSIADAIPPPSVSSPAQKAKIDKRKSRGKK